MDKEKYSVKCVEIEGGYKIEIKGPDLKGLSAGCLLCSLGSQMRRFEVRMLSSGGKEG
jgi:hypothetical protein